MNAAPNRAGAPSDGVARYLFIGVMLGFIGLFLVFPVIVIMIEALRAGLGPYFATLGSVHSWTAIRLTLLVAAAVVPLNTIFGVLRGLVDQPFPVSRPGPPHLAD